MVLSLRNKHVILDNNIIFDFGVLDDFLLLNKILSNSDAIISPEVNQEVKEEIKLEKLRFRLEAYSCEADYQNAARLKDQQKGLTEEDISCLVLAKKLKGLCASNDKLIRKVAKQEGVTPIGSIGLLEYAVSLQVLTRSEAGQILCKMKESGAFLEQKLIDEFIGRR